MFDAYFDASGKEEDSDIKYVAVSGFAAKAGLWKDWESEWLDCLDRKHILNKHGLPEFHMVDCANYSKFFEGWETKEDERQKLLHELVEIINTYLGRKISCVVSIDDYQKCIDADLRDAFGISGAYVIGGRTCAARVKEWGRIDGVPSMSQTQFFFEDGDGDVQQNNLLERLMEDEFPKPNFKRKKNKYSKLGELLESRLIPFQASDVWAYLSFLHVRNGTRSWGPKENIHWMLTDLSQIPEPIFTFDETFLRGFNKLLRICKDIPIY